MAVRSPAEHVPLPALPSVPLVSPAVRSSDSGVIKDSKARRDIELLKQLEDLLTRGSYAYLNLDHRRGTHKNWDPYSLHVVPYGKADPQYHCTVRTRCLRCALPLCSWLLAALAHAC